MQSEQNGMSVQNRARWVWILSFAWMSTYYVLTHVIVPYVDQRIVFADQVLSGHMESPYQYRVLKHVVAELLRQGIRQVTPLSHVQHIVSYGLIVFATFVGVFWGALRHFERHLSPLMALLGLALLQTVIPLSVTGFVMEGDFITLLVYLLAFEAMAKGRDLWLIPLVGVGAFNREQVIFVTVFYLAWVWGERRRLDGRVVATLMGCGLAWAAAWSVTHLHFGEKGSQYTMALHVARNTAMENVVERIVPLWVAELGGLVWLSVAGMGRSSRFLRAGMVVVGVYAGVFCVMGNLWELAKFLPAFLILIPVALRSIDTVGEEKALERQD